MSSAGGEPPPDLAGAFEALHARSLAEQVRAASRYRDLLQRVAAGDVDAVALRAEYDRLVTEQGAQLARDLTALGVRYYQSMLDVSRAYIDRVFDELAVAPAREPPVVIVDGRPEPVAEEAPAAVELRLRGRVGELVEATFAIENKRDEPADIAFLLSDFTGEEGAPFRAPLELDPPRFRIDPVSEHPVTLRLQLDPELFAAGMEYRAEALVRGSDELELRLVVAVEE